jgi:hypothetical protein
MNKNWLDIKFQIYNVYLYQFFRQYFSKLINDGWNLNFEYQILTAHSCRRDIYTAIWHSLFVLNFIRRLSITERNKF